MRFLRSTLNLKWICREGQTGISLISSEVNMEIVMLSMFICTRALLWLRRLSAYIPSRNLLLSNIVKKSPSDVDNTIRSKEGMDRDFKEYLWHEARDFWRMRPFVARYTCAGIRRLYFGKRCPSLRLKGELTFFCVGKHFPRGYFLGKVISGEYVSFGKGSPGRTYPWKTYSVWHVTVSWQVSYF